MRKAIFASLALCPMLLHAQTNSLAQTTASAQGATLESTLRQPNMPGNAAASDNTANVPAPRRVSSGVISPRLVRAVDIAESKDWGWIPTEEEKTAVVSMVVDPTGKPSDLHVVQSLGADRDKDVLAAVSQYRFQPGTLNHEPTPIELSLKITILKHRN